MLTKKQMSCMKIMAAVLFVLAYFTTLSVSLSIFNVWGNYEKSRGIILSATFGLTLIFTIEYALIRKPLLLMIEKMEEKVQK